MAYSQDGRDCPRVTRLKDFWAQIQRPACQGRKQGGSACAPRIAGKNNGKGQVATRLLSVLGLIVLLRFAENDPAACDGEQVELQGQALSLNRLRIRCAHRGKNGLSGLAVVEGTNIWPRRFPS
jgi:hypothetical protein